MLIIYLLDMNFMQSLVFKHFRLSKPSQAQESQKCKKGYLSQVIAKLQISRNTLAFSCS